MTACKTDNCCGAYKVRSGYLSVTLWSFVRRERQMHAKAQHVFHDVTDSSKQCSQLAPDTSGVWTLLPLMTSSPVGVGSVAID